MIVEQSFVKVGVTLASGHVRSRGLLYLHPSTTALIFSTTGPCRGLCNLPPTCSLWLQICLHSAFLPTALLAPKRPSEMQIPSPAPQLKSPEWLLSLASALPSRYCPVFCPLPIHRVTAAQVCEALLSLPPHAACHAWRNPDPTAPSGSCFAPVLREMFGLCQAELVDPLCVTLLCLWGLSV